jgi:hypothetical protein
MKAGIAEGGAYRYVVVMVKLNKVDLAVKGGKLRNLFWSTSVFTLYLEMNRGKHRGFFERQDIAPD